MKVMNALIFIVLFACTPTVTNPNWSGGRIIEPGVYQLLDSSLTISVFIEKNFVRYKVEDKNGLILIKYNYNISNYKNWAFYLDEQKSFWVFSSDIGHTVWGKMGNTYTEYPFNHIPTRGEVPEAVYIIVENSFMKNRSGAFPGIELGRDHTTYAK